MDSVPGALARAALCRNPSTQRPPQSSARPVRYQSSERRLPPSKWGGVDPKSADAARLRRGTPTRSGRVRNIPPPGRCQTRLFTGSCPATFRCHPVTARSAGASLRAATGRSRRPPRPRVSFQTSRRRRVRASPGASRLPVNRSCDHHYASRTRRSPACTRGRRP